VRDVDSDQIHHYDKAVQLCEDEEERTQIREKLIHLLEATGQHERAKQIIQQAQRERIYE
jgi:hypothetical protein